MKRNVVIGCLAATLVLAGLGPIAARGQNIGFQVGIASPPTVFATPQPPAVAVRDPLTGVPVVVVPPPPLVVTPRIVARPGPHFISVGHRLLLLGTPRTEVLRLLGRPTGSIVAGQQETLFFPGGISAIIQNGQLAGAR